MRQLQFFIALSLARPGGLRPPDPLGFFALKLIPAGAWWATLRRPALPFISLQTALRLRPRRALSSAEAPQDYHPSEDRTRRPLQKSGFARPSAFENYKVSGFANYTCPVLLAPRQ